jgi:inactivated superfamily I helicase
VYRNPLEASSGLREGVKVQVEDEAASLLQFIEQRFDTFMDGSKRRQVKAQGNLMLKLKISHNGPNTARRPMVAKGS